MVEEIKKQYNHMMIKTICILSLLFFICSCMSSKLNSKTKNSFENRQVIEGFLNYDNIKDTLICENNIYLDIDNEPIQKCIAYFGGVKDSMNLDFPVRLNTMFFSISNKGEIETYESSSGNLQFEENNTYKYDFDNKKWFNTRLISKEYENGVLVDSINETFDKAYSLDLKMYKMNGKVYRNEEN